MSKTYQTKNEDILLQHCMLQHCMQVTACTVPFGAQPSRVRGYQLCIGFIMERRRTQTSSLAMSSGVSLRTATLVSPSGEMKTTGGRGTLL